MTVAEMRALLGLGGDVSDAAVVSLYVAQAGNPATFAPVVVAPPPPPYDPNVAALAAIRAAFIDPEPIVYRIDGADRPPFHAIRSETTARDGDSYSGNNLRRIFWEIHRSDLPRKPANRDTFAHRGRRWEVTQVEDADDVEAWVITVTDAGAAL